MSRKVVATRHPAPTFKAQFASTDDGSRHEPEEVDTSVLIRQETAMRTREFQRWIRLVSSLSLKERTALRAEMAALDSIDAGVQAIERRVPQCCPHCAATHVVRNGRANGLQRYRYHDFRKTLMCSPARHWLDCISGGNG